MGAIGCLLYNNLALHASALVGLAVVGIGARCVERGGHLVTLAVKVVLVGKSGSAGALRDLQKMTKWSMAIWK